uniref:AAA domain-containing protein n=1 Tax=Panagrellus redivivus TaxID=6233 RepID=A0A7E4V066_PANRE
MGPTLWARCSGRTSFRNSFISRGNNTQTDVISSGSVIMWSHCLRPSTSRALLSRLPGFVAAIERSPNVRSPFLTLGPRYLSLKPQEARFFNRIYEIFENRILQARRVPAHRKPPAAQRRKEQAEAVRDAKTQQKDGKAASSAEGEQGSAEGGEGGPPEDKRQEILDRLKKVFAISLFIYGLMIMLSPRQQTGDGTVAEATWSDFTNKMLPTGQVSKVQVFPEKDLAYIYCYAGAKDTHGEPLKPIYRMGIPSVTRFESEVRAAEAAINLAPEHWTQIEYKRLEGVNSLITLGFYTILLVGAYFLFRKVKVSFKIGDIMSNVTKSQINILDPLAKDSKLKIKLKDVAGLHEAKVEINEFVDYLKNPAKYAKYGAKLPKGAILTGPPGCGKTLLAKALAAESSAPFISMNGTEFIEMIGGLGASRVRNLFKEAKARAPCIIYIDEIDAIGRKRSDGGGNMGGGSGEEEQTLNQLLVEMDGMDTAKGVIMIASTNRPDILDRALMRPGRFDRHISVDLPTVLERQELFDMYLNRIKLDKKTPGLSKRLAQMTPGMSGADIANVVNEAAIHAASAEHKIVNIDDLTYAMDRILAGPEKRSKTLVQEEREVVAYHESGHALVGWLLEHTDALLKVTIIPRTSAALGFAQYNPRDRKLYTKEELFDRMCMALGGRAAENVFFGRITTGAQNDLEKVTKQAYAQVKNYGMSTVVGPLSFSAPPGEERASQFYKKPFSNQFKQVMDNEVSTLVAQAYWVTEELIRDNKDKLEVIAKALLERETLSYEDVKKLIGPPTHGEKNVIELADQVLPDVPSEVD